MSNKKFLNFNIYRGESDSTGPLSFLINKLADIGKRRVSYNLF